MQRSYTASGTLVVVVLLVLLFLRTACCSSMAVIATGAARMTTVVSLRPAALRLATGARRSHLAHHRSHGLQRLPRTGPAASPRRLGSQ